MRFAEWIKGTPIPRFRRDMVYVVEFWATWCGPCRAAVPHLTKLAQKHRGKAEVIGVSIWERGEDIPGQVRRYVQDMGDRMDYHVALDTTDRFMATRWMQAAGMRGIPAAFIVDKSGRVAWIGHPMQMDEPLAQIVEGTWDIEKAAAEFKAAQEREAKVQQAVNAAGVAEREERWDDAIAAWQSIVQTDPNWANPARLQAMRVTILKDKAAGLALAKQLVEGDLKSDLAGLAGLANVMLESPALTEPADFDVALSAARAVIALGREQDAWLFSILARVYEKRGDKPNALATYQRAIEVARAVTTPDRKALIPAWERKVQELQAGSQ